MISHRQTPFSVGNRRNLRENAKILRRTAKSLGKCRNLSEIVRILGKTPKSFGNRQNPSANAKIFRKTAKSLGKRQFPSANTKILRKIPNSPGERCLPLTFAGCQVTNGKCQRLLAKSCGNRCLSVRRGRLLAESGGGAGWFGLPPHRRGRYWPQRDPFHRAMVSQPDKPAFKCQGAGAGNI